MISDNLQEKKEQVMNLSDWLKPECIQLDSDAIDKSEDSILAPSRPPGLMVVMIFTIRAIGIVTYGTVLLVRHLLGSYRKAK
jgi:hypothetical protein